MATLEGVEAEPLCTDSGDAVPQQQPLKARLLNRRPIFALAAAAAFGSAALLVALRPVTSGTTHNVQDVVLGLNEDPMERAGNEKNVCSNYPKLLFTGCSHNNLALKGPDQGDEGIVYPAKNQWTGHEFEVVVNAISSYKPFSTRMNGMSGEYGTLNIVSGSEVKVKFSVRHKLTKEPITQPYFALTFFDLDQGLSGTSRESITVSHFTAYAVSDDVEPGSGSELKVVVNKDGSRTFKSSEFGTGADNPKHPLNLNKQQKNRAVSLRFRNFRWVDITFKATEGIEPRFFTFVAYPALVCSSDYKNPTLVDLVYSPNDTPVKADRNDLFKEWMVKAGDHVKEGDPLCKTEKSDGSEHVYRAPIDGEVTAVQAGLKEGDLLSQRLDDKTVAVLTHDMLKPLPVGPGDEKTDAPGGKTFKKYHVMEGDVVTKGDPIADVMDANGEITTLTAAKSGPITALQDGLEPGDSTDKIEDGNVATIGRLPELPVGDNQEATTVPPGCTFVRYLVDVGDPVEEGVPVAEVEVAGKVQEVQSTKTGTVTARQEKLEKGMAIGEALKDNNILVVGSEETKDKLPPLKAKQGEHYASVPPGMTFEGWHKEVGDTVSSGDPLLYVKNQNGDIEALDATGTGVVMQRQEELEQGDKIDERMMDTNLMVVGKLPPLDVDKGEAPSNVPQGGDYTFHEFKVKPGEIVDAGDPVATVKDPDGKIHDVRASKYGTVKERQEHLTDGANINGVMEDRNVVTIGKFPAVEPSGVRQAGVEAPEEAIFSKWYVEDGDKVEAGDPVAQVILPDSSGLRRLEAGYAPANGVKIDIPAPTWGTITDRQPLVPGQKISEQQEGSNIVTLDQGPPWWLALLGVLSVLGCALCLLFCAMKKPQPAYQPMPQQVEEKPLIAEEKPDGLRLDFHDGSRIHTVYAKYRPLGIKHNFKAPIIANDFTINSYAKQYLGVKEGWKLTRIADEELHDNRDFSQVTAKLSHYMRDFPLFPLPIDFKQRRNNEEATCVEFRVRPIGIEFTNRAPIKVGKVTAGTPAEAAGVQEGWYVTRIGEADVTQNSNFREVIGYFNEGVQPLDEAGPPGTHQVLRSGSHW